MKELYYCTKIDSKGNKLTSSYTTKSGADKYGKGCTVEVDILRADFSDRSKLQFRDAEFDGPVVRGVLRNNSPSDDVTSDTTHAFELWGMIGDKWGSTGFSFPSYSAANTMMKNMIFGYQSMAVLDTSAGVGEAIEKVAEPQNLSIHD